MKNILLILIFLLVGCSVNNIPNTKDGTITVGDGNFVYYAPNKSRIYKKEEITKSIDVHQTTIQIINKRINYYEYLEGILKDKYDSGEMPKKKFEKQKEQIETKLDGLKYDKNEAEEAFELWKGLLSKNEQEESEYERKLNLLRERENQLEAQKKAEDQRISSAWKEIDRAQNELAIAKAKLKEAARYKPTNCHRVTFSGFDYLVFRNKPLTREEINALNSCTSWMTASGETRYEDLGRRDCQIKKKLDEESTIGFLQNGDIVDYLGVQGSWNEVVDIETGQRGFIAAKYGGRPTLVKTQCN